MDNENESAVSKPMQQCEYHGQQTPTKGKPSRKHIDCGTGISPSAVLGTYWIQFGSPVKPEKIIYHDNKPYQVAYAPQDSKSIQYDVTYQLSSHCQKLSVIVRQCNIPKTLAALCLEWLRLNQVLQSSELPLVTRKVFIRPFNRITIVSKRSLKTKQVKNNKNGIHFLKIMRNFTNKPQYVQ